MQINNSGEKKSIWNVVLPTACAGALALGGCAKGTDIFNGEGFRIPSVEAQTVSVMGDGTKVFSHYDSFDMLYPHNRGRIAVAQTLGVLSSEAAPITESPASVLEENATCPDLTAHPRLLSAGGVQVVTASWTDTKTGNTVVSHSYVWPLGQTDLAYACE